MISAISCRPQATLLADADTAGELWREKVFGLVLVAARFQMGDKAVALANSTG